MVSPRPEVGPSHPNLMRKVVRKRRPLLGSVAAASVWVCAVLYTSEPTVAQDDRMTARHRVAGTVTDLEGRPLAFASVTLYRDAMALEVQGTDLRGQFALEAVVGAASHSLEVTSGGATMILRLSSSDTALTIRIRPRRSAGDGLSLAHQVDVSVVHPSGADWQDGDSLFVGEQFTMIVTSYGTGLCTQPGPVIREVEGNEIRIAVSDSHYPGICHLSRTSHRRLVRHMFGSAGIGIVRVISRSGEQTLRLPVYRRSPGAGSPFEGAF